MVAVDVIVFNDISANYIMEQRNITVERGFVDGAAREVLLNQRGCAVWFTGLSGVGEIYGCTRTRGRTRRRGKARLRGRWR
jgi:hypothetical protein